MRDTSIYRGPQWASLAHVIRGGAIAQRKSGTLPVQELRKYAGALDDVSLPLAEIEMTYNGGWEYWLCRVLSLLTLVTGLAYAVRHVRRAL